MVFVPCCIGKQRNPLVLAPKKSVALQLRRQPLAGVTPISGGSNASVTTSSADQVLPTMAPVPSIGQTEVGAKGVPLEVKEQQAMATIPLPTMGQMGLPTVLVAPTVAGAT